MKNKDKIDEKRQFPCRESELQKYDCQVCVRPKWKSSHKWISVDKCLIDELFYLWDLGIITTGCCCGNHKGDKKRDGYIGVEDRFIPKMKELEYKVHYNKCRPKDEDSFIPKTNNK